MCLRDRSWRKRWFLANPCRFPELGIAVSRGARYCFGLPGLWTCFFVVMSGGGGVGAPFTDLEFETVADGKPCKLSDFAGKGRPVIIDLYATW